MTAVPAGWVGYSPDEARELVAYDWIVTATWNRLHHPRELSAEQWREMADDCYADGPVTLACGRIARWISIPGFGSRMGRDRCIGCCRALGYPQGVGSPKNDQACRVLLGLSTQERAS